MHKHTAEEEHALVNSAPAINLLVPDVLHGQTLQDRETRADNDPEDGHDEEELDGDADHGELEDAPVEGEEGDFGGGDGGGVA